MRDEEYRAMFDLEEHLWWYEGMRAITESMLGPSINQNAVIRSLDIGCGTGYSMKWLEERFKFREVFGVDVSRHASVFWKERGIDTVALASADKLPFNDSEFDVVTCFDVIYQLNDARAAAAVSEMRRVLTPGGLLFIREPAYQWMRGAHDVAVGTHRRYTLTDLRRLLVANGFKIRRATYANTLLFWLAAPHRLLSKWRGSSDSDVKPVPGWINRFLLSFLKVEAQILGRVVLPFGLSVIGVAEIRSQSVSGYKSESPSLRPSI